MNKIKVGDRVILRAQSDWLQRALCLDGCAGIVERVFNIDRCEIRLINKPAVWGPDTVQTSVRACRPYPSAGALYE